MKIDDRTYFEEEQRLESNWIWVFVLISSLSMVAIAVGVLYNETANWLMVGTVLFAVVFSDGLIIYLFKTMKLELAITKKGLHYRFFAMVVSKGFIDWSEVSQARFAKPPTAGYGKKYKFRYGEVFTMNLKKGVELHLKNGKKKFFSLKDPDAFRSGLQKIETSLRIE